MIEKITSENPENHWRFLNPKDKIIMDMGCSFWDSTWHDDWFSSSEWFVHKGAKQVVGFDASLADILKYNEIYANDERYEMFFLHVKEKADLLSAIQKYKPEVIKCDIEGAEIHFDEITSEDLESVSEIAIEYHNVPTREMCERKLIEWNFNNHQFYQLGEYDINQVGVYHLWK